MGIAILISSFIIYFIYMIATKIIETSELNSTSKIILFIFWIIFYKLIYSYLKEKKLKSIAKNELKIEKYKKELEKKQQ